MHHGVQQQPEVPVKVAVRWVCEEIRKTRHGIDTRKKSEDISLQLSQYP